MRDFYIVKHADELKALTQFRAEAESIERRVRDLGEQERKFREMLEDARDTLREVLVLESVTFRLEANVRAKLAALAKERGVSEGVLLREAVKTFLVGK